MDLSTVLGTYVPQNLVQNAEDGRRSMENMARILLEKKKLPDRSWTQFEVEYLLKYLASLDSSNFPKKCGLGEREGRVFSSLVLERNFGFSHGLGRSGNLTEHQPKAVGSSVLNQLTNSLLLDLLHTCGLRSSKKALLVPMATGMTLMLCLLTLKRSRPRARYVLWSRIDQKSCFKAILTAGLEPVVIDTVTDSEGQLQTDVPEFSRRISSLKPEEILCLYSTSSCFAPRGCDDLEALSRLAKDHDIPHLVNNAYGLQSSWCCHQIEQASVSGRVDFVVQSTDKNLMVPVGGAVVASPREGLIEKLADSYVGRASSSQALDVLITLLEIGRGRYLELVRERKRLFEDFYSRLRQLSEKYGLEVLRASRNPISLAVRLKDEDPSSVGAKLFKRGVSGTRVVAVRDLETDVGGHVFRNWGAHTSNPASSYLTVAVSIGCTTEETEVFLRKFEEVVKSGRK